MQYKTKLKQFRRLWDKVDIQALNFCRILNIFWINFIFNAFFLSCSYTTTTTTMLTHKKTQRTCFYGIMRFFSADISLSQNLFIQTYIRNIHTHTHTRHTLLCPLKFYTMAKYSVLLIIITKVCCVHLV